MLISYSMTGLLEMREALHDICARTRPSAVSFFFPSFRAGIVTHRVEAVCIELKPG
jgi:hypothetical protein